MSNKKVNLSNTINYSLSPKVVWINNSRIRLKFKGSCLKQAKVTFTQNDFVNLFIAYELDRWSRDLNTDFILKNCFFGSLKLTKDVDPDKYKYSGFDREFNSRSEFSLPDVIVGKMSLF